MKKNINIRELERWLKSSLKNKVSIDNRSVIAYLMMGFAGLMMSTIANAGWINPWGQINYWQKTSGNADAFTFGWDAEKGVTGEGSVMIAKGDKINQKLQNSVVIGYGGGVPNGSGINAETQRLKIDVENGGHGIVAIGSVRVLSNPHGIGSTGNGGQGVAIGNDVTSTSQAVAIGNNTYALGNASIAVGSDDISTYRDKITNYDYKNYLQPLYNNIDSSHTSYGIGNGAANDIYSPNVAGGTGSIAIGSRTMAYKDGSTALGTLAYALGKGATALGTQSRAEGEGSIAVGNKTRNFANQALAIGNDSQILNVGGTAVGLRARSGGEGSIAIGTDVYANVIMNTDSNIKSKLVDREMGTKSTTIADVENTVKDDKAINPELTKFHDIEGIIKTTANQKNAIVIGTRSVATGDNAMALGRGAFAMANNAFGIGSYSYADHVNAMAIGTSSRALAENSITVGAGSVATAAAKNATVLGTNSGVGGENSSVVGSNSEAFSKNTLIYGNETKIGALNSANATDNNIAIGNKVSIGSGVTNSMAYGPNTRIGDEDRTTNSKIDSSTAFGSGAVIERLYNGITADKMTNAQAKSAADKDSKFMYTGNNAMAIGNYSRAVLENSVALGVRSDTDYTYSDLLQPGWTARGSIAVPTSGQTGVISVGSKGQERRIVNVASGYRDTDAVNVIQLRTLEETVTNKVDSIESGMHYLSVNKEGDDFNGEKGSKKVTQLIEREKNFNQYVRYRIQQIQLEARQKWQGEKFNEESLREIDKKVAELGADPEITRVASDLKNKTITTAVPTGKSPADAYRDLVNELESIRYELVEKDRTDLAKIDGKYQKGKYNELLAGEDIAALKKVTNYSNEGGQGDDSLAVGFRALAAKDESNATNKINAERAIAMGYKAKTSAKESISIGDESNVAAAADRGIAVGYKAQAEGARSLSLGSKSKAQGELSIAIGSNEHSKDGTTASGKQSIAFGNAAKATAEKAVAMGPEVEATNKKAIAIGSKDGNNVTKASGENAVAIGSGTEVSGGWSVGIGSNVKATSNTTIAIGDRAEATADKAVALGAAAKANIANSVALGQGVTTTASAGAGYLTNQAFADSGKVVSVGQRRINQLADGKADDDAVTVAQLKAATPTLKGDLTTERHDWPKITPNATITVTGGTFNEDNNNEEKFYSGSNLKTLVNGTESAPRIEIGIKKVPTFRALKLNNEEKGAQTLTLRSDKAGNLDVGSKRITGVSNATEDNDAVNYSQLKGVSPSLKAENAGTGITNNTLKTNNGATIEFKTGDFSGAGSVRYVGENISTHIGGSADAPVVTVGLRKDPTFETLKLNNGVGGASNLTLSSDNAGNLNVGNKKITGVADGTISATSTDAINGKQLNTVKTTADTANATANTAKTTADTAKATADTAKNTADTAKATADTAKNTADTAKATADTAKNTADTAKATADTAKNTADDVANKLTTLGDKTLTFSANSGTAVAKKLGESIGIEGDNTTISTKAGNNKITIEVKDGGISTAKLADKAVTTAKLNDGAVTEAKLDNGLLNKINAGNTVATNKIRLAGDPATAGGAATKTTEVSLNNAGGIEFAINGKDGLETKASGTKVEVGLSDTLKTKLAKLDKLNADADATYATKTDVATKIDEAKTTVVAGAGSPITVTKDNTNTKANAYTINVTKGNVTGTGIKVENGNGRVLGSDELKLSIEDKAITEAKLSDELKGKIDGIVSKASTLKISNETTTNTLNLNTDTLKIKGEKGVSVSLGTDNTFTVGLDENTKARIDNIGKVADGKDGKDAKPGADGTAGTTPAAGTHGLTGKDGLNGKDLTTKVNALRNGEAGTVVFTDAQGNRLVKANNGNYYKADEVGEDGNPKTPTGGTAPTAVAETDIELRVVTSKGETATTSIKLSNIANGKIDANSKDAINGSQIKDVLDKLGVETDTNGNIVAPTITGLKDTTGTAGTNPTSVVDGLNKVIGKVNEGIKYAGNTGSGTQQLGTVFNVVRAEKNAPLTETITTTTAGATPTTATTTINYVGDNLITKYTKNNTDGSGKLEIGFKESPTFKDVTAESVTTKTLTFDDGKGNTLKVGPTTDGKAIQIGDKEIATKEDVILKLTKDGTTEHGKVDLSKQKLKVVGSDGVDVSISGQEIGVKLDTATKNKLDKLATDPSTTYATKTELDKKANKAADNLTDDDVTAWKEKLGLSKAVSGTGNLSIEAKTKGTVTGATETDNGKATVKLDGTENFKMIGTDGVTVAATGKNITFGLDQDTKDKINNVGKSTADGRDGQDGKPGHNGANGLTAKDGLNGKDLTTKVNALRNGEAGTVVYTDAQGNRLVKANDGKYYKPEFVSETGELKQNDAGQTGVGIENPELRVVNANGETIKPTTLNNLASGLGLTNTTGTTPTAITAADAKTAVSGLLTKTDGLNKAVTVGDLQALAQAGLDFEGNAGTTHKALGTTLKIIGKDITGFDNTKFTTDYSTDNVATNVKNDGTVEIGFKKSPTFTKVKADEVKADEVKITKDLIFDDGKGKPTTIVAGDGKGSLLINGKKVATSDSAPVLYTDKNGNVVEKGLDGKIYKVTDLEGKRFDSNTKKYYAEDQFENGVLKAGAVIANLQEVPANEVKHALAALDNNSVTNAKVLTNVADGKIGAGSTEAINGKQLKDLADKVGLGVNADNTTFTAPTITAINKADGTADTAKTKIVDGLNAVIGKVNEGIKYKGDLGNEETQQLGTTFNVNKAGSTITDGAGTTATNYVGSNLITKYTKNTDGSGKLEIGFKESPTFKDVTADSLKTTGNITAGGTITGKDGKFENLKVTEKIITKEIEFKDGSGNNLTLVNGKDGNLYINGVAVPSAANAPVIYTNEAGNRVELGQDGKVYEPKDLKGLTYVKEDTTKHITAGYYDDSQFVKENGTFKKDEEGNKILVNNPTPTNLTDKEYTGTVIHKLSAIKPNDTTARILRNVADGVRDNDAVNMKQFKTVSENKIKLTTDGTTGNETTALRLDKTGGISFGIKGANGIETSANGTDVTVKLKDDYKNKLDNLADNADTKYATKTDVDNKANKNADNLTTKDVADWKAKLGLSTAVLGNVSLGIEAENKETATSTTSTKNGSDTLNLTAGDKLKVTGIDDVEVKVSNKGITVGLKQDTVDKINNIGKVSDGKDGKDAKPGATGTAGAAGAAGTHGLTGKDGLNGKDLTTKVNALRNGEAGTVVFTDKDGNRLVKANDGKYYKAEEVEENGNPKTLAGGVQPTEVAEADIELRVVDSKGETKTTVTAKGIKLSNVADGKIDANSKDAINGSQIKKVLDKIGVTTDANGNVEAPTITKIKDDKGDDTTVTAPTTLKDGLNAVIDKVNKGIKYAGDSGNGTQQLGTVFNVNAATGNLNKATEPTINYVGSNLITKYTKDTATGDGKLEIGFKESPTFKDVTATGNITGKDGKFENLKVTEKITTKEIVFQNGNGKDLTIANGKDGKLYINGVVVPTAESAPVIYTNANGDRVELGQDGKVYKPQDLEHLTYVAEDTAKNIRAGYYDDNTMFMKKADGSFERDADGNKVLIAGATPTDLSTKVQDVNAVEHRLSPIDKTKASTTGYKLTNVADGELSSTSTDAVNGKQLNAVKETPIKFVGDDNQEVAKKLGETLKINGDGIKVSKNATGDGLVLSIAKGKVETINVADKAITSAKLAEDARTVVYVTEANEVIELGADGKLHKATDLKGKTYVVSTEAGKTGFYNDADLNSEGQPLTGKNPVTVAVVDPNTTKLRHALNGYVAGGTDVTTKSVLTNVGAGKIDANSTDAINGSQLKAVADKVGLTVDATNTLSLPAITALKDAKGNNTTAPTTLVGGLNEVIGKVNEGLSYKGDLGTQGTQQLGSTVTINRTGRSTVTGEIVLKDGTETYTKYEVVKDTTTNQNKIVTTKNQTRDVTYVGDNLITKYTKDTTGNGKFEIGFKENPTFKQITADHVDTKTITFNDGQGNKLTVGPSADGKSLVIGEKEIATKEDVILKLTKDGTTDHGKVDLSKDKLHVASGNNVTVDIANNKITVGLDDATKDKLANLDANANTKYANKDASNITGKDLAAWKTTLGINNVVSGTGNLSIDAATLGTETGATETANGKATVKLDGTENFKLLGTDGITVKGSTTGTNKTLTFGLDDTTKAAIKNIGKSVSDGRDGKDATNGTNGVNGTNGLTAKDGLNGKDLTTKVNALRNGEAGTVVFTDKDGNRLVKANDGYYYDKSKVNLETGELNNPADAIKKATNGNYYKADKVDATGTLTDPNATPVEYNPELRVVNEDGSTKDPNKLSNIADGKIDATSKDAINGSQIKNVLDKLGVETDTNGNVVAPTITAIKGADGKNGAAATSVVDGLNKVITTVNSGINYAGDSGTGTQQLGSKFSVNRAGRTTVAGETALTETVSGKVINYVGDNVITKYTKDATGNGKLEIGFKESPTFKNVTAENIDAMSGKLKDLKVTDKITTKEIVFDSGTGTKLTLVTGKDGNLYINGVAVPTAENAPVTYTDKDGNRVELGQDGNLYKPADIKDLTYVPADATKGIQAGYYEDNQFEKLADGSFKQDEHGNKVLNGHQTPKDLTTKAYNGEVLHSLSPINKNNPSTTGYRLVHVADGKDDTDAVNMKQLNAVKDSTITFKGDTAADTVSRKLGETLNITGNGIKVTKNKAGDGLELSISKGKVDTVNVKDKAVTSAKLAEDARTVVYVTPDNKAVELGADGKLHKAEDLAGKTYVVVKNATGAVDNTKTGYYADTDVNEDGELKNPTTATKLADPEEVNPTATKLRHALNGYVAGGTNVTTKSVLTNVGEGTISATSTDAINGAQFHKLSTNTIKLTANGVTTGGTTTDKETNALKLDNTGGISFGIKGADGITTTANGTDVTVKLDATTKAKLDNLDADANNKYAKKDATNMTGLTDEEKAKWREAIGLENAVTGTGKLAIDTAIKGTGTGATETNKGTAEVKLDGTEKFKMIGTGGVTVEATGKEITFGLDKDTTDKLKNITAVADGRDGKDAKDGTNGYNGSHGLTGKDGLNGKDLTTKVNALRNGEAGTVVFTDKDGNRLVKANDGNYYKADEVGEDGNLKTLTGGTTPTAVAEADIELRVVNSKGETATTPIKLSNIADGKIDANSKDAINGSQIKDVLDKLGVEIDSTTGAIKQPTITAIKGADGKDGAATTSVVAGLNKVIETVNSGIKYNGDLGTEATQQLGSVFNVNKAGTTITNGTGTSAVNYVGDNLITKYTLDTTTGNGKLEIGLKESPTFKDVTADNLKANTQVEAPKVVIKGEAGAGGAAGKDAVLTADNNGNLKVGNKTITAGDIELGLTGKTVKADGTATTVGGATTDKVNLSAGEKLEVVGKDGVTVNIAGKSVTLGLDKDTTDKLKNITAVSDGKDGKATNGTDGSNGSHGLTGKDGLNGKDLTTKVNALRNGEAGTVVFTDKDGNRLVKANDGKYYLPNQVDDKGNVITTGGTTPTAVDNPELRVVNANGETTKPTALNNLASGLGLTNTTGATPTAITANDAKTTVNNLLTKTDGLNKAVNVGDLQALAQAGLNFTGNSGNAHAPLSTTVNVAGQGTPATGFVGASGNINVVASEDTTTANKIAKLEIQLAEALKGIKSIQNGDTKITLDKDNGVKVDGKDGGKVVVNGKDGKDGVTITGTDGTNGSSIAVNGKDGKDGVTIKGTNGTDGSSIVVNGKDGADGKDSVTIKGGDGTNGSSIAVNGKDGKDGVTIKGTNGTDGSSIAVNGKDGKDGVTIKGTNGTDGSSIAVNGKDGKDAVTIKGGDGTNGSSIAVNGKDGKDGVTIKGGDGTNGATITFDKKTDAHGNTTGTGSITGLKDPELNADGTAKDKTAATTVNYVTNQIEGAKTEIRNEITNLVDGGMTYKGNSGDNVKVKLNEAVNIKGEGTYDGTGSATGNIAVVGDNATSTLEIKLNKDLKNIETISNGDTKITLDKDNGVVKVDGTDGGKVVVNGKDGNSTVAINGGDGTNGSSIAVNGKDGKDGVTITGTNGTDGSSIVVNGKDGAAGKDSVTIKGGNGTNGSSIAVNGKDGKDGVTIKGTNGTDGSSIAVNGKDGKDGVTIKGTNGTDGSSIAVNGKDGKDGVTIKGTNGTDGSSIAVNGKDGKDGVTIKGTNGTDGSSIAVNGKDGKDGVTITGTNGTNGSSIVVNGKDGQPGVTINGGNGADGKDATITFTKDGANGTGSITGLKDPELNPDGTPKDPTAATTVNYVTNQITNVTNKINDVANKMDKGLNFVGNSGGTVNAKLDGTVSIKGEGTIPVGTNTAANNITVEKDTTAGSTGLVVKLADKLTGMTGFETKEEDGKKVTINKDGISLTTTGTPGANLKLGTDGTITGVVAKPDDKTSVATVGYVDSKIGSGITFGGDKGNNQAQELGTTLKVKAATETITANAKDYQGNQITYKAQDGTDKNVTANYRGNNLITSYNYDTANKTGTISVAMSERPEFAAVTVGKGDTKATLDGEKGSLEFNKTIEKGKDGQPIVYANNDGKIVKYKDEDGNLQPIYKQIGKGTISGLKDVDYLEVDGNRVAIDRTQAVNAGYVDDQLVDVRTRINNNTTRITELSTESRAGIAGVAAMANIPQINDAGSNKYNISVGIGKHRGETAYALGISGVSDSGRVVYKASAALDSQNKVTAGIGLGYQFGKRDIEPSELDRFKAQMTLLQSDSTKKFEKLEREQQRMREEQEAIKANQYRMQEAIVAIDKKTDNIDKLNQMKMNQLEERINQKVDKIDSLNQLKINQINKEMEKVKNKLKIYK